MTPLSTAVFSTKPYDQEFLDRANAAAGHPAELRFLRPSLERETVGLAAGHTAVVPFVNDVLNAEVLEKLHAGGTRIIAMRCAGYNNVDLDTCKRLGIVVARVPAYSPHGVAEHAVGLMLALNRHIHRAYNRVREGNFELGGLLGFNFHGHTVGVVGTGKIGACVISIMKGFGCRILAYDVMKNPEAEALGATYVGLEELLSKSDIISLHCPLTRETHHLIDEQAVRTMKRGVMLINTSRGALVDTRAVLGGLKSGQIGYLGLDVYEEESGLFFRDLSSNVLQDDVFARLLTFPNVLVTGHQAFFTREALSNIAETTIANIAAYGSAGADGLIANNRVV